MADRLSMASAALVRKAEADGDVDFHREGVRVLSQALMDVEVAQHVGAARYERIGDRERDWDTRAGTVALRAPRVHGRGMGATFPP